MKTILCLLFSIPITITVYSQSVEKHTISTKVNSVTVYLSGAEVERKVDYTLKQGLNELRFNNISTQADSRSIQFELEQKMDLLSITMERDYLNLSNANKKIKTLQDSLELLSEEKQEIDDELSAFEAEKQVLLKNQKIGGDNVSLTVEQIKSAADFYRKRTSEINKTISQYSRQKKANEKQTVRLEQQLREYNYKENVKNNVIVVLVEMPQAGKISGTLKYNVGNTGWAPSYDLIAEDISGKIELKYKAKVFNNTGNDWENVDLKLSTGDPNLSASIPLLDPWHLNNYSFSQTKSKGYSVPQAQSRVEQQNNNLFSDGEGRLQNTHTGDLGGNMPPTVTMTTIEVSELTTEFEIEKTYSIPSDSRPYIVEITEYDLEANFSHLSVPKLDKDAFLLAKIAGWEKLDLVPGPSNVYFAKTYVGESYINTRNVEDTLGLSFGRDEKILVTRRKVEEFSSKNVIGNWKKDTYTYELIVKNNRNRAISMELNDQVPVSQDGDITVSVDEISDAKLDDADGKLTWNVKLEPGEAKKYKVSFTIKYPKTKNISVKKYRSISAPSF
ncbi:MAG: mucoidy inhibitor MuiA family protein [Brumimicrobium sp.]